jgi:gamma-glutamylcyclotransferase (GGCT)/AIG2-like uncharacterized protein YtfP
MDRRMSKYLAVYGTLRKGHGNWQYFLSDVPMVAEKDTVKGYRMVTFGGFPAIVATGNDADTVVVDVFDVEGYDRIAEGIEGMERGAGYDVTEVLTSSGLYAYIYTYTEEAAKWMDIDIPDGDWTNYVTFEQGSY